MVQLPRHTAHTDIGRVSIEELKKLIDENAEVVVLDVQQKTAYDKGHIKGAISFPWKQKLTLADTRFLPRDKPLVTYCDCGPKDTDSSDTAAQLIALGLQNVKVLADPSIKGWLAAGYPIES
ncbi:MAG: rhodanese-like domain-containing protein [Candidatus Korobacteraceae bacterium]|jgi:rhodanese-related sulfurtransferase